MSEWWGLPAIACPKGKGNGRGEASGSGTTGWSGRSLSPLPTDGQHSSPGLQELGLVRVYKDPSPSSLADPTNSTV